MIGFDLTRGFLENSAKSKRKMKRNTLTAHSISAILGNRAWATAPHEFETLFLRVSGNFNAF